MSDFSAVDDVPFTLSLGAIPTTLYQAEVHLIFVAQDGTSRSHRLYRIEHSLDASEDALLDDNYIERRDGRFVIYHADSQGNDAYVPFFPDLPAGRYRIRAVLTDPALSAPVYSQQEVEMDYPPALSGNQDGI